MASSPRLHVSLTTTRLRRGVLLVVKHRRPLRQPLGPGLTTLARRQAEAATVAEARWLLDARDRGVVALRRVEPSRACLWTAHVTTASLAAARVEPVVVADVLRQTAATLVRLRRRGLTHGALTAEHVLLQPLATGGVRAVLCAPAADPDGAGSDGDPLDGAERFDRTSEAADPPHTDLAALTALVADQATVATHRRIVWQQAAADLRALPLGDGSADADVRSMTAAVAVLADLAHRLGRPPSGAELMAVGRAAGAAWWAELRPSA